MLASASGISYISSKQVTMPGMIEIQKLANHVCHADLTIT